MNYYPNTWRGAPRGAGPPDARGPQRHGAQCNRIGCIGLRPALVVSPLAENFNHLTKACCYIQRWWD